MVVLGSWQLFTRDRIVILTTEFLAAAPAPRSATTLALLKALLRIQATRKDVVARSVLQGPAFAVRALLCVVRHYWVLVWWL